MRSRHELLLLHIMCISVRLVFAASLMEIIIYSRVSAAERRRRRWRNRSPKTLRLTTGAPRALRFPYTLYYIIIVADSGGGVCCGDVQLPYSLYALRRRAEKRRRRLTSGRVRGGWMDGRAVDAVRALGYNPLAPSGRRSPRFFKVSIFLCKLQSDFPRRRVTAILYTQYMIIIITLRSQNSFHNNIGWMRAALGKFYE